MFSTYWFQGDVRKLTGCLSMRDKVGSLSLSFSLSFLSLSLSRSCLIRTMRSSWSRERVCVPLNAMCSRKCAVLNTKGEEWGGNEDEEVESQARDRPLLHLAA